jgi:ankyrin repeat protein
MLRLSPSDPLAADLTRTIKSGDVGALQQLLRERPDLANARIGGRNGGSKTLLHLATDWPGFFPNAPEVVRALVAAGASINATTEGHAPETPLHWAASSDDVAVAETLIDAGADLELAGGSIAEGTPLVNAVGYACWEVAHLLVRRGARVDRLWVAAGVGLLPRVNELLTNAAPAEIDQAFWHACSGGQRRTAEVLLARGANIQFVPDYAKETPLGAVTSVDTRRQLLADWLREHGAR